MRSFNLLSGRLWPIILLLLLGALAACGGDEQPPLVIPTAMVTAAAPTAAVDVTVAPPTPTVFATATLPPPPTVAPPLPTAPSSATATPGGPAAQPSPTIAPTIAAPTATPVVTIGAYRVAFVAAGDTLNVRRRPGANEAIIAQLPPNAGGIQVTGEGEESRAGTTWLPVTTTAGNGWVNSRFLTEDVSREVFCGDPAVTALLDQLRAAVAEEDGRLLEELVHPERGLRVRLNWWNPEVLIAGNDVRQLFRANKQWEWGTEDGSGRAIRGSFDEVVLPQLERDLLPASDLRCDEGVFGPTAGLTNLPEGYEAVRFYSLHRPAPAEQELDWGTWLVGIERWEGRYYVSYLVHYRWEI